MRSQSLPQSVILQSQLASRQVSPAIFLAWPRNPAVYATNVISSYVTSSQVGLVFTVREQPTGSRAIPNSLRWLLPRETQPSPHR